MTPHILESDLFRPVEEFLEKNGYLVHAEVLFSDISAIKGDELLIVEMKTRFNLEVVLQAVKRQESADVVYIAVPVPAYRRYPKKWTDIKLLCKRLGLGILFIVMPVAEEPGVAVVLQADPSRVKGCRPKKKQKLLAEIRERPGNYNVGGSVRKPIVTAYRTEALKIASLLSEAEALTLKEIRERTGGKKTASILQKNYYDWFLRVGKGSYSLTEEGKKALKTFAEVVKNLG